VKVGGALHKLRQRGFVENEHLATGEWVWRLAER